MKNILAALALWAVSFSMFLGVPAAAQMTGRQSPSAGTQDQMVPPQVSPDEANESKTFTGKIIQSGDKLVLTDATGEAIYQLDDQARAKEFLNKNVKVTGILDAATKIIHVSDIEPV